MVLSRATSKNSLNNHEVIEISDSESERNHDTKAQKMKKFLNRRTAEMRKREEQLVQQVEKYQKENENMLAECASYKTEIVKLREALKLATGGNKKNFVKTESQISIEVDLGPAIKAEKKEEEDSKVKIDSLVGLLVVRPLYHQNFWMPNAESTPTVSNVPGRDTSIHQVPPSPQAFLDNSYSEDYQERVKMPVTSEDESSIVEHESGTPHVPRVKREPTPDDGQKNLVPVVVKSEDHSDESKHVEEGFHAGFSRKLAISLNRPLVEGIKNVFITGKNVIRQKFPYVTFKRSWNSQFPFTPGAHGVVFKTFEKYGDDVPVREPIDFIVAEKANHWQYCGTYDIKSTGGINPSHLGMFPPGLLTTWVKGLRRSQ
ncbi:hypothetical protein SERLADRAFT_437156 [Serpula lacrymans var. lacrymans S7.9]|uniref:DUF6697 domain-containing protein n=1 Tax=Serpula lacrymans var. lacrymans (strain S7.9) TaxID=578457 RepID=F8NVJ6_SERL9|nr:uncharacterized protein SERLADRAFT_437156 [Serpula lacrymans var. lacrymans S7.9]EGO25405.1 hypothetical protein SERLADRAFT_437156 [Serpula lacrymans var. lacrymans S7.9]